MKKKLATLFMVVAIIASFTLVFASEPVGFSVLDNFDNYTSDQALVDAGYGTYAYGNLGTTIEVTSTDMKAGKGLKVSNNAASERIDFVKEYTMVEGATGFSFWVNNTSDETISIGPMINYNAILPGEKYFLKSEGSSTFVETEPTGNQWYPIQIAAGEKVEIAIPFSVLQVLYEWENPTLIMSVWGVTTLYSVVFDDIQLYGLAETPIDDTTTVDTTDEAPKTGDTSKTTVLFVLILIALTGIVLSTKSIRKYSNK